MQTAGPLWLHHAGRLSGLKAPGRRGTQARAAGLAGPLRLRRVPVHGHAASADLSGHHGRLGVSGQDPRMLRVYSFVQESTVVRSPILKQDLADLQRHTGHQRLGPGLHAKL